jgi:hypothetical protein
MNKRIPRTSKVNKNRGVTVYELSRIQYRKENIDYLEFKQQKCERVRIQNAKEYRTWIVVTFRI